MTVRKQQNKLKKELGLTTIDAQKIREQIGEEPVKQLKDALYHPVANEGKLNLQMFQTEVFKHDIEDAKLRQADLIINAIINSTEASFPRAEFPNEPIYCMSGLIERLKRLPTIDDKIEIVKGHYYFTPVRGKNYIISEVNFNLI